MELRSGARESIQGAEVYLYYRTSIGGIWSGHKTKDGSRYLRLCNKRGTMNKMWEWKINASSFHLQDAK